MYDSVIIGASAAGMSAAIYLKRRGMNFLLLGKDIGGEMLLSGEIENYPGIAHTNGFDLTEKFKEHLHSYQIPVEFADVQKLTRGDDHFKIDANTEKGLATWEAKSVIVATGSKPKKLNVPGEDVFYQRGVSYCTVCDGPIFKEKAVAVIGGGNSANEAGIMMGQIAKDVYVLTIHENMKGDEVLIKTLQASPKIHLVTQASTKEIFGKSTVEGLRYEDKKDGQIKELPVEGIFIHIGMKPNSDFVPQEWNIKNQLGEIVADKLSQTTIPGLFAAGDITDAPFKQIGIAVGQGVTAALSAISYVNRLG